MCSGDASVEKEEMKIAIEAEPATKGGIIMVDGEPLDPPSPLPWYPDQLAWRISCSKKQLKKAPALEALFEFVKRENEFG